jgi:hypothetical protein
MNFKRINKKKYFFFISILPFFVNLNRKNSLSRLRLRLRLASLKKFNRLRLRLSNRLRNRSYNRLINRDDYTSLFRII